MLKAGDQCRNAAGDNRAEFKESIQIRLGLEPNQPGHLYQLNKIFRTKSGSARVHIWELLPESQREGEIIVAFSPAGTPDAVLMAFDDIKNILSSSMGYQRSDEEEAISPKSAKEKLGFLEKMKTTISQREILINEIRRNYSAAEKTRARQALDNLYSLAEKRKLVPFPYMEETLTGMEGTALPVEDIPIMVHSTILEYYLDFKELGLLSTVRNLHSVNPRRITIIGYSMGAMLSLLLAHDLQNYPMHADVILFGCPRTGNLQFLEKISTRYSHPSQNGAIVHFIHDWDPVVNFPPTAESYADACHHYIIHLREDKKMPWTLKHIPDNINEFMKNQKQEKQSLTKSCQNDEEAEKKRNGLRKSSEKEEYYEAIVQIFVASRYHDYKFYSKGIKTQSKSLLQLSSTPPPLPPRLT